MIHVRLLYRIPLAFGILAAAGCGGGDDEVAALRREVAELRQTQAEMQTTLATLQRGAAAPVPQLSAQPAAPGAAARPPAVFRIPTGDSPRLGNEAAAVTVVQLSDFQSPASRAAAKLPQALVAAHPEDVQVVFKQFPVPRFPQSREAARAAWAAQQQGKFWVMRDLILAGDDAPTADTLRGYAERLGLDRARFASDMASPKAEQALATDRKVARTLKVGQPPAYFVNGRRVLDRSPAGVRAAVAEQVARSRQQPRS